MEKTDFSAFSQYIPGFDFLQQLARQATGAGNDSPLGHWIAPTFSIEEVDKRIQDLKVVAFWLEQNAKALNATIQALEVQKMTLATLDSMNLGLRDVAASFQLKPQATPNPVSAVVPPPPQATPEPKPEPAPEPAPTVPGADAVQWWNALTEQFSNIASHALQDMAQHAAKATEQVVQSVQASAAVAEQMASQVRDEVAAAVPPVGAPPVNPSPRKRAASKPKPVTGTDTTKPRRKPAAP